MKRIFHVSVCCISALIALLIGVGTANAQVDRSPELLNVLAINRGVGELVPRGFVGVGARAMGMGGAQIAVVNDGSALYWNPAMLAYLPRIELAGGVMLLRSAPTATYGSINPTRVTTSARYTRLNSLLIAVPYPVYRGGLTIAFGATRPTDYAYRSKRTGDITHLNTGFELNDGIRQEGGITEYAMGFGVQASEAVALGATATWYSGSVDIVRNLSLIEQNPVGNLADEYYGVYDENQKIRGFTVNLGTSVSLPFDLTVGAVVPPPFTYSIDMKWGQEYEEYEGQWVYPYPHSSNSLSYRIRRPWRFGLGAGWTTYALTFSGDMWYEDWTQARYSGRSPFDSDASVNTSMFFEDRYRSTLRWHFGAEYLLPVINTKVRAGYYSAPEPFIGPDLATGKSVSYIDEAGYFTFGAGWLIDNVVALDIAYTTGGDKYRLGDLVEQRNSRQILITTAFRF